VVEVPVPVPVEATTPELPWDLQNIAVVTSVARPVVSSPTSAIHLGYGETMASIGQGVVGEAHCISLVEVAAEQMLEPIASFCKQNPFLSKLSNSEYQIDIAFKS
jgi:hypothetical protein